MFTINCYGIITIFFFEIKDFFKEYQFNIIAPLINTLLFFLILSTIHKYYTIDIKESSYINFLIPGIIMMVVIQTSFNHLSEVIIAMKQIGSFNDYLVSPISRIEIFMSLILSSIFVCLFVGILNLLILSFFTNFYQIDYINLFYYLILAIIIFASIGALTGFLSFTWDVQSTISNFFIVPISLFSGTFFSINAINEKWQFLFNYNPFYHLVNGFRSSFDNNNLDQLSEIIILITVLFFFASTLFVFQKGFKVIF